jgi:hypothetical protein
MNVGNRYIGRTRTFFMEKADSWRGNEILASKTTALTNLFRCEKIVRKYNDWRPLLAVKLISARRAYLRRESD